MPSDAQPSRTAPDRCGPAVDPLGLFCEDEDAYTSEEAVRRVLELQPSLADLWLVRVTSDQSGTLNPDGEQGGWSMAFVQPGAEPDAQGQVTSVLVGVVADEVLEPVEGPMRPRCAITGPLAPPRSRRAVHAALDAFEAATGTPLVLRGNNLFFERRHRCAAGFYTGGEPDDVEANVRILLGDEGLNWFALLDDTDRVTELLGPCRANSVRGCRSDS